MSNVTYSNTTAVSDTDKLSIRILRFQTPAFVLWLVIGLSAVVGNSCVVLTISKAKHLHTKCMCTLASLACGDCLTGLFYLCQSLKKFYFLWRRMPETTSSALSCIFETAPIIWSTTLSDTLTLALSFDRLLAMGLPFAYKMKLSKNYVLTLNGLCWFCSTCFASGVFFGYDHSKNRFRESWPICSASLAPMRLGHFYAYARLTTALLNLCLFTLTSINLWLRLRKSKSMSVDDRRKNGDKIDIRMLKTLAAVIAVYALFKLTAYVWMVYLMRMVDEVILLRLVAYNAVPVCFYSSSHLLVYLLMSKCFRKGFFQVILKRKSDYDSTVVTTAKAATVALFRVGFNPRQNPISDASISKLSRPTSRAETPVPNRFSLFSVVHRTSSSSAGDNR